MKAIGKIEYLGASTLLLESVLFQSTDGKIVLEDNFTIAENWQEFLKEYDNSGLWKITILLDYALESVFGGKD